MRELTTSQIFQAGTSIMAKCITIASGIGRQFGAFFKDRLTLPPDINGCYPMYPFLHKIVELPQMFHLFIHKC